MIKSVPKFEEFIKMDEGAQQDFQYSVRLLQKAKDLDDLNTKEKEKLKDDIELFLKKIL